MVGSGDPMVQQSITLKILGGAAVTAELLEAQREVPIPEEDFERDRSLSSKSIEGYVSGLCRLYHEQITIQQHNHPNPRGVALKSLNDYLKRSEYDMKRANLEDRGRGTVQDTYNPTQMRQIMRAFWKPQDDKSKRRPRYAAPLRAAAVRITFFLSLLFS